MRVSLVKNLFMTLFAMLFMVGLGANVQAQSSGSALDRDYIIVTPGLTLTRIMRDYYPNQRKAWPKIMENILRENPHAFRNNNPAKIKPGVRLKLPGNPKKKVATKSSSPKTVAPPTAQTQSKPKPVPKTAASTQTPKTTKQPAKTASKPTPAKTVARSKPKTSAPPKSSTASSTSSGGTTITVQPIESGEPIDVVETEIEDEEFEDGGSEAPPWWWTAGAGVLVLLLL